MIWQTSRFQIDLNQPRVMGIVNVTPDSFSDGGKFFSQNGQQQAAFEHCEQLLRDGADMLDIGGESSRPGAPPVPLAEELARVLPVVRHAVTLGVPVSVDTYKPEVMEAVLDLAKDVVARHGISASRVLGHSDVAPLRKEDPGELFDWHYLAENGVGLWAEPKPCAWSDAEFLLKLGQYGYDLEGAKDAEPAKVRHAAVMAFSRHFRPARLASVPDPELKAVLNGLIDLAAAEA